MSFVFCGSCQRLCRSVLSFQTPPRPLKTQYMNVHHGNYRTLSLSSSSLRTPSSHNIVSVNQGKLKQFTPLDYMTVSYSSRRTFFTESKLFNVRDKEVKKEQPLACQVGNENEDESIQEVLLMLEEEDLTEEEKLTLKELEEEERKLRESFNSGIKLGDDDERDYTMWNPSDSRGQRQRLSESVSQGHVPFENRQRVIQDVIDEMWNPIVVEEEEEGPEEPQYYPRGKTGVFDLGELVDLLKDEGADELVAIALPKELDYADYMVIVTVVNDKQLIALATFVRKRFKMKELKKTDVLPFLDKKRSYKGWIALDLGNIILQLFTQDVRDYYDLETLWTVGPLFDDLTNAKDPEIIQLLNSIV